MALGTVEEIVRGHLPFLQDNPTDNAKITAVKMQQYYFLSGYLNTPQLSIEDDAWYTGTTRLLVAALTAYRMLGTKALENVGGNPGAGVNPGAGTRRVKKGKADVVEGEFEYVKASDGTALVGKYDQLATDLLDLICTYASALKISLPMCACWKKCDANQKKDWAPGFIVVGGGCGC